MSLFKSRTQSILLAWFVASTLDILCAVFLLGGGDAAAVFRYIAQGAFGDVAFQAGPEMVFYGFVFHYVIGFCFTLGYFLMIPHLPFFKNQKIISGLMYGVFVWAFMRFLILPFTYNVPEPLSWEDDWKNILILMLAFGLPIAFLFQKHDQTNRAAQ